METLIESRANPKIVILENPTYSFKKNFSNLKSGLDLKFYQKLFVILLTSCTFLIFPESPQNFDDLCNKNHPKQACIVW